MSAILSNNEVSVAPILSLNDLQPVSLLALSERPTVSVLISCYNYGPFVGQAIESALRQTYAPLEVIVSDDASKDDSCAVVEKYARQHPSVKLVRNEHGGMAKTLNAAYRASSGQIVCLLDADDVFLPEKLERVVSGYRTNPRVGFLTHPALLMDHKSRSRGVYPLGEMPSGDCAATAYASAGILMGLPPTTNLTLRREVAERIFPLPPILTGYAEQMLHRMAPFLTEIVSLKMPLAEWRQHGKNDQKATHISASRLHRELSIMELLWDEQRQYLSAINPELGRNFPPLTQSYLYRKLRYTEARLAEKLEAAALYKQFAIASLESGPARYFWEAAPRMPLWLFSKGVDLLMTQSILKEIARKLKRG